MNSDSNAALRDYETSLEANILDCQRMLRLGLEAGLKQLQETQNEARIFTKSAELDLRKIAGEAEADIAAVQKQLGKLNYLLAEDAHFINSPEEFAPWRDRITKALHEAYDSVKQLDLQEDTEWHTNRSVLIEAWSKLHQQLEIIHARLALDSQIASERSVLIERQLQGSLKDFQEDLRAGREQPGKVADRFRQVLNELCPEMTYWLKALLMYYEDQPPPKK